MGKITFITLCLLILIGCSSVSDKDKEYMQIVLNNELWDCYNRENLPVMFMNAEIKKVEKKVGTMKGVYTGTFGCSFEHAENKVYITGEVDFDENMQITNMPKCYGNGKKGIDISAILINSNPVPPKEKNKNQYILDCFMNRNKISGNE